MNKKVPERKCLGCNLRRPKNELVRVVRTPDGGVVLDKTGKLSGRGAYLCPDAKCLMKAKKQKRLETNLMIAVPDSVYETLAALLEEADPDAKN